jgi:hypothetical protein
VVSATIDRRICGKRPLRSLRGGRALVGRRRHGNGVNFSTPK